MCRYREKSQIITALGSFHGRTLATLTATGQEKFHKGFAPLPQGFDYVPFNDIAALEARMSENTAAVMLEPIQGEGGVRTPADGYLQQVRALCDKYDALLIFDEIQTGMGRTGSFYAYESCGVTPDIVTLAMGLAGGVPIGAFIVTEKVAAEIRLRVRRQMSCLMRLQMIIFSQVCGVWAHISNRHSRTCRANIPHTSRRCAVQG